MSEGAPASSEAVKAGRRVVALSRPDKVLFPRDGITKRDLTHYDRDVAPAMLPHLQGRPLTMERYPDGIDAHRLIQKRAPGWFPDWIPRAKVAMTGGTIEHPVCNDAGCATRSAAPPTTPGLDSAGDDARSRRRRTSWRNDEEVDGAGLL